MNSLIITACIGCIVGIAGTMAYQRAFDNQESWKTKYYTELVTHENTESELKAALQHNQKITNSLIQWKDKYAQASHENAEANTKIETLSRANKEMCDFLSTGIPDDLWTILFPKTDKPAYCTN